MGTSSTQRTFRHAHRRNATADAPIYSPYFPTRPGYSADASSLNTGMPQMTSSSTGLQMAEVAENARRTMDEVYRAGLIAERSFHSTAMKGRMRTRSLDLSIGDHFLPWQKTKAGFSLVKNRRQLGE